MAINATDKDGAADPAFGNETRGHEADDTAEAITEPATNTGSEGILRAEAGA